MPVDHIPLVSTFKGIEWSIPLPHFFTRSVKATINLQPLRERRVTTDRAIGDFSQPTKHS